MPLVQYYCETRSTTTEGTVRTIAQKIVTLRISDISGEELGDGGQTINFSVGTTGYTIDLSDREVEKFFNVLKPYVDNAQKTSGRGVRRSRSSSASEVDPKAVRAWAAANDVEVNDRGRIPADIIEKYKSAGN